MIGPAFISIKNYSAIEKKKTNEKADIRHLTALLLNTIADLAIEYKNHAAIVLHTSNIR